MNKKRKEQFQLTESMKYNFKKLIKDHKINQFRILSAKNMLIEELNKISINENNIEIPITKEIEKPIIINKQKEINKEIELLKEEIKKLKEEINKENKKEMKIIKELKLNNSLKIKIKNILNKEKKEINNFIPEYYNNNNELEFRYKPVIYNKDILYEIIKTNKKEEGKLNEILKNIKTKTIEKYKKILNENPYFKSEELIEHKNNLILIKEKLNKENMFLKDLIDLEKGILNIKPIIKNKLFFLRLIDKELKLNKSLNELKNKLIEIFEFIKKTEYLNYIFNFETELETKRLSYKDIIINLKNKFNQIINSLKLKTINKNILTFKCSINLQEIEYYKLKEEEYNNIINYNINILNERTLFYKNIVSEKSDSINIMKELKELDFNKYNINNIIKQLEEYRVKITCGCDRNIKNAVIENCMHTFCRNCLEERVKRRERSCPICQKCFANFIIRDFHF